MEHQGQGLEGEWALILGASSGFGEACALELARLGMDIFGVHLDRRAAMPRIAGIVSKIEGFGGQALYYNVNAADDDKRAQTLGSLQEKLRGSQGPKSVRVVIHSLAFGTLKPYVAPSSQEELSRAQMEMTLDVMAHSLVYWVRDMVRMGLLAQGSRVFAMTSGGAHRVSPSYGAISAAKAALESHVRQLAYELAPCGITVNAIRAGVTDTPALRKIPGHERLMERAQKFNPHLRLTTPKDVASAIGALSTSETYWVTGNIIGVDGGEGITGF